MFGLFRKKKLPEEEIYRRAESCLGQLLIMCSERGEDFQKLVSSGYLGFTKNSVFYSADFNKMHDNTICFVKLSDVTLLRTVRPATSGPVPMIPQELMLACLNIPSMVKSYPPK